MAMAATSDDRILFQLKTRGPQTAADIGTRLGITPTGARQHLVRLQADGLVEGEEQPDIFGPIGEPPDPEMSGH